MIKRCLFSFAVMLLFLPMHSHAKDRVGNGGDQIALQFVYEAKHLMRLLSVSTNSSKSSRIISDLEKTLASVQVQTTLEPLMLSEVAVDAINYPDSVLVKLNRGRWTDLFEGGDKSVCFSLILHELLGLAGYNDSKYQISDGLMSSVRPVLLASKSAKEAIASDLETLRLQIGRLRLNREMSDKFRERRDDSSRLAMSALDEMFCFEQKSFSIASIRLSRAESSPDRSLQTLDSALTNQLTSLNSKFAMACSSSQPRLDGFATMFSRVQTQIENVITDFDVDF